MVTRINGVQNISAVDEETGEKICSIHSETESVSINDGTLSESEQKKERLC